MTSEVNRNNLYAQVNERAANVTDELWSIANNELAEETKTPEGTIDHQEWLKAEKDELREKRRELMKVTSVDGTVDYQ